MSTFFENKMFYDEASSFYDEMIEFDKNLEKRKETFANIFEPNKLVADLGCGTGLDSVALALNGNKVFAFDPSLKMIEVAKQNSFKFSVDINFLQNTINNISQEYHSKFNYVVSLGNTLANVEGSVIYSTIQKIYDLLVNNGKALIHILNYHLILERQERILSIKEKNNFWYIRFYDFVNGQINFNVLKFEKENPTKNKLITTQIFGYKLDLLTKVFESVGFKEIEFWSDLNRNKFDIKNSKDLFIYAKKS
ncbi:MAG: class I SAM-dependent methyltransferase [Melioribacteraceae bacterium]|nr:class I SAM-dependent methyltransferase [Melioribacteraceae bacterium]